MRNIGHGLGGGPMESAKVRVLENHGPSSLNSFQNRVSVQGFFE